MTSRAAKGDVRFPWQFVGIAPVAVWTIFNLARSEWARGDQPHAPIVFLQQSVSWHRPHTERGTVINSQSDDLGQARLLPRLALFF